MNTKSVLYVCLLVFCLGGITGNLLYKPLPMSTADAQSYDGEWRVIIDEKGKVGVMWSVHTGRMLYSHKGTWTNGPFSHWREAQASK